MEAEQKGEAETASLIGKLIQLQNEVVYVVECIAQDHTGEVKRGIWDVEGCLNKSNFPNYIDAAVRVDVAEAEKCLSHISAHPQNQLFLCFEDGTSFEFWCGEDDIHPTGGFSDFTAKSVGQYMEDVMETAQRLPPNPLHKSGPFNGRRWLGWWGSACLR